MSDDRLSSDDSFSLLSEDELSVAEEVQQLNSDVINRIIQDDDMIGGGTVMKTMTHRDQDEEELPEELAQNPIRRRSTIVDTIKKTAPYQRIAKMSWFDTEFKRQRVKVYSTFLVNYLILSLILTIVLSVMWGSYYKRNLRYHNMKIIVVNDDQSVDGITPIVGNAVNRTATLPEVAENGGWTLFTHQEMIEQAKRHNNTIREEVERLVHHQEYWAGIYVYPNITHKLYEAIANNDTTFYVNETMVEVIYESGRDFIAVGSYVLGFIQVFEKVYMKVLRDQYTTLVGELPDMKSKLNALNFLSMPATFLYSDGRPVSPILMAPLQLGLTYLVAFSFFQLVMTIRVQIYLASIVHGVKYLLVRMLFAQLSYLVLAAAFVLLNVAFQIDVTAAFGKSGGLVLLAVSFLTMGALGTLNEIMAALLFTYYPALIGGWIVCLMVFNVAPTSSPLALLSPFYRYGYAMPIHNSYELAKVVFCDTYKGQMGRNFGILFAWIVCCNALLPFVLIHVSKVRAEREKRAKEKAELKEKK